MTLHVLSGGAAKGVVASLQSSFMAAEGVAIDATFGAVGAMKQRMRDGAPCDVVILTAALIEELERSGEIVAGSSGPLGRVSTGIAIRRVGTIGSATIDVSHRAALIGALRAARGIYFPDPEKATAGIHFARVLDALGIAAEVAPFLRPYPDGASAMAHLAASTESDAIGCTQVTEILYTEGVTLVAALPKEFELVTMYVAAVASRADDPKTARRLVALLSGSASTAVRRSGGFDV